MLQPLSKRKFFICGYPVSRAMEIHESNLKYVTKIYVKSVLIYDFETWEVALMFGKPVLEKNHNIVLARMYPKPVVCC